MNREKGRQSPLPTTYTPRPLNSSNHSWSPCTTSMHTQTLATTPKGLPKFGSGSWQRISPSTSSHKFNTSSPLTCSSPAATDCNTLPESPGTPTSASSSSFP
eukprot:CAMPEP_0179481332 /NCGR_PEP_ID=MMETSP0799-20121207/59091_1 /TAXON_ID=46947 /ORGANISM="Geminigera cryophila, Strain CCMP2564" /LENGTH=101 /DNA_ID=CAMNT_0021293895 /DNA_START=86 /DNA_END=388 /DNA_ORIENTATION=+